MLESMRKPFFIVSLIAILLVLLVELGSMALLHVDPPRDSALSLAPNGKAIPMMAFLDGLVFYVTLSIGIALIVPERVQSKVQGIVTLIFSFIVVIGGIAALFVEVALVMLMVSLLLSVPFGTIAYFAIWANFDTSNARLVLSLLMMLKIIFAVCLVLAHQRFLENKVFVLIILTSFISNLIIAFLHGFVPGSLVSITDGLAAIVICAFAIVWGAVYLYGGGKSVGKVIA